MKKIIPIRKIGTGCAAETEDAGVRLERAGFLRLMTVREPQLSAFVEKYKAKGYGVEVVPFEGGETGGSPDGGTVYVRMP